MSLLVSIHALAGTSNIRFDTLKEHLIQYPILRQPDFHKKFFLFTDASNYAFGFVLSQMDNDTEYVVMYGSRSLKGAEIHYEITEKESLCIQSRCRKSFGLSNNAVFISME